MSPCLTSGPLPGPGGPHKTDAVLPGREEGRGNAAIYGVVQGGMGLRELQRAAELYIATHPQGAKASLFSKQFTSMHGMTGWPNARIHGAG